MRVVICGDSHIGAIFGLGGPNGQGGNTRIDDFERTLNYIADYIIDTEADIFIQTGDIFDLRIPSLEHMEIVNKVLMKLSMAHKVTAVIMGNHDYRRSGDSFTSAISSLPAKDYSNVRLVLEPQIMSLTDRTGFKSNILLMPYRDRRMYPGENIKEISQNYNKHVRDLLYTCTDTPTIAVGHNFFYEGSYFDYGGNEILADAKAFDACELVVMGHQHTFRHLQNQKPKSIYIGSMEKMNFGDIEIDKIFLDYNLKTKEVKELTVPSRQLLDQTIDLSEIDLSNYDESIKLALDELNFKDKIVRLKIVIKDSLKAIARKNLIEKELYSRGAFYVSKVNIELIYKKVIRDNSILESKDNFSMFEAFINSQNLDDKTRIDLLKEAKKIIE